MRVTPRKAKLPRRLRQGTFKKTSKLFGRIRDNPSSLRLKWRPAKLLEVVWSNWATWKGYHSTWWGCSGCTGCSGYSRFSAFVSYHPCWGGLLWGSCLWVIFAPVNNPSSIFPWASPIKLSPWLLRSLVISVLWSVMRSLSGVRKHVLYLFWENLLQNNGICNWYELLIKMCL